MLEFNPIHKALQSSCHSSALVTSLIPGFAALRCLSVFLTSLVQDPNILLLSSWPMCLVSLAVHCLWYSWAELGPQGHVIPFLLMETSSSCHCAPVERKLTVFFCRESSWTSTVFLAFSLLVGFSLFSSQLWDPGIPSFSLLPSGNAQSRLFSPVKVCGVEVWPQKGFWVLCCGRIGPFSDTGFLKSLCSYLALSLHCRIL